MKVGLELRVQLQAKDGYRTTITVVRRIRNELVIHGDMRTDVGGAAVAGLDDLLQSGMGQDAVANQDVEAANVSETLSLAEKVVQCEPSTHRVVAAVHQPPATQVGCR